jgi:hypothetical protein
MCRNIHTLFNYDPPASPEEIRAAALQYVRKISGFTKPSKVNEAAFLIAVEEISTVSSRLIQSLQSNAPAKSRAEEAVRKHELALRRFSSQ